jgi:hypothetical protein
MLRWIAIASVAGVVLVTAGWVFFARNSRYFLGTSSPEEYLDIGDVVTYAGPVWAYPEGDMYLIRKELHSWPWLFSWSVEDGRNGPSAAAHVDWRGRVYATSPGHAILYARARGGHKVGLQPITVLPPIDTIALHLSADTLKPGETLHITYKIVVHGRGVSDWSLEPTVEGDAITPPGWLQRKRNDQGDDFSLKLTRTGTARVSIKLGKHVTVATAVVR